MSAEQLKQVIAETLSPYAETRRAAEENLKAAQRIPGHPLEILKLVASSDGTDPAVRQAAAVHFKNLVKKGWDPNADADDDHDHDQPSAAAEAAVVLAPNDRVTIKGHLVQLMCTTPPQIQVQLSEAISLIAATDFPDHWTNLLPELVQQFSTPNPEILVGVLKTANSIFKSFRHAAKSDELYRAILVTLHAVQAPLLALFTSLGQAVDEAAAAAAAGGEDKALLAFRLEALRLVCRIFYSLNFQDLPEFFEDHMGEWMAGFAKHLQRQIPAAADPDEQVEPSPLDKLQAAVITNLALYAEKDEEPFLVYLPNFTTLVWNLLVSVTPYPKHDSLATTSIRFLSSLVEKLMHRNLFEGPGVLQQIVGRIVVPNLMFRDSDEERFEDDPREFLVTEVEGSDSETRRRCSQTLLRAMCRQFEQETTAICMGHVDTMLREFAADPDAKWKAKDAAIHLMMGIAIRRESRQGVSEVNDAVNLLDFFQANILPELQNLNHASRPVVKATAIKFVCTFRNQFSRENLVQLLPLLISHLGSSVVVVHTFAAYAIERILVCKEDVAGAGARRPKLGAQEILPLLEPLFSGLFSIIDNAEQNENDYAMKCVMRSLATAKGGIIPVTQVVITKLTAALGRIAKNPRNPQYNHYLFESIAVLVRSVCSTDPNQTAAFEPLLFEPFNIILQMDIAEFTPYVFQVLAQLLEYRPANQGLGPAYTSLFAPILTPVLWEQKGNVPALTRLLQAYVRKAPTELLPYLDRILGVFQKLISAKSTECSAFDLLSVVTSHVPHDAMDPKMGTVFQILLVRLQGSTKAPRYKKLVTTYFALFVGKYGPQAFVELLDRIQPGLAAMVLEQVWNPRIKNDPPIHQRAETKVHVVGLTKLLFESPLLLADPRGHQVWSDALAGVIAMLTSPDWRAGTTSAAGASLGYEVDDEAELEIGYDAQFSKLSFASRAPEDFFPEVPDPGLAFCQSLRQALASSSSSPTPMLPLVQNAVSADEKLSSGLEAMMLQAGLGGVGV